METRHHDNHVKILFRYFSSILDKWMVETMWAEIVSAGKGLYRIANIPFYGPPVASGDVVLAEYDVDEEMLTYRETVEYSDNSIVTVVMMDKRKDINDIQNSFNELGCSSERFGDGYFSMEVLSSQDYTPIKQKLVELRDKGIIDYAEPYLSAGHQI